MEFSRNNNQSVTKLNTNGCCFLCLQNTEIKTELDDNLVENLNRNSLLRCLLRHFQIKFSDGLPNNNTSCPLKDSERSGVEVNLCEICGDLNSKILKLFLHLEKIQMEMEFYLEWIHHRISDSLRDPVLVQNYSKKMTSDRESLRQLSVVDKLRKEILNKSLKKKRYSYVNLTRIESVLKTETDETDGPDFINDLEESFAEVYSQQNATPPPSPYPTSMSYDEIQEPKQESSPSVRTSTIKLETTSDPASLESNKKVRRKQDISAYYSKNESTGNYHCTSCEKPFVSLDSLIGHYKVLHLRQEVFKCNNCSWTFYRKDYLSKHKKTCKGIKTPTFLNVWYTQDNGIFKCVKCKKTFKSYITVRNHYKRTHLRKIHKYEICKKAVFSYKSYLTEHQKSCREIIEKRLAEEKKREVFQFSCNFCGKRFFNKGYLYSHQLLHKNENRYHCNLCNRKFNNLANFKMHKEEVHFGKRFYCAVCNKSYTRKYKVKRHEKICKNKIKSEPEVTFTAN